MACTDNDAIGRRLGALSGNSAADAVGKRYPPTREVDCLEPAVNGIGFVGLRALPAELRR